MGILETDFGLSGISIYRCGAADARGVGSRLINARLIEMLQLGNSWMTASTEHHMEAQFAVLEIIGQAPHPIGWYSIAHRLGMRGIVFEENLVAFLSVLQARGLVQHIEQEGYPHGAYRLTDKAKALLARQQSEQES